MGSYNARSKFDDFDDLQDEVNDRWREKSHRLQMRRWRLLKRRMRENRTWSRPASTTRPNSRRVSKYYRAVNDL
jgi:hypothetical protein